VTLSALVPSGTFRDNSRMTCSRNRIHGPFCFRRKNTISKYPPEFAKQRDASTDTTAVDFGSSTCGPSACVMSPVGDAHHREGAIEIREGGIAESISNYICVTYGA
jgi:hypothetical protein